MRAFFAWRLHAGCCPNEADVGRHGAVVIVVEKDAPVAPAPAPEVTTAPVDEAPEGPRASVVDVRTDAPLPDAQLTTAPAGPGIVASSR